MEERSEQYFNYMTAHLFIMRVNFQRQHIYTSDI